MTTEKKVGTVTAEISSLQRELEVILKIKNLKQKYDQIALHINQLERSSTINEYV